MDLEIRILSELDKVKSTLKSICTSYHEDFLLDDIVFITIDDKSKLNPISKHINIRDEDYAYQ